MAQILSGHTYWHIIYLLPGTNSNANMDRVKRGFIYILRQKVHRWQCFGEYIINLLHLTNDRTGGAKMSCILRHLGIPTDTGLQLGKTCYPCSR